MVRSIVLRALALVALVCAGVVVVAVAHGSATASAIGLAVIAVGAVLLVSLAFYEVGRSEDRERSGDR